MTTVKLTSGPMLASVALVLAGTFIVIAAFHIRWALRSGRADSARITVLPTHVDGTPLFRPGRTPTLGVALLLVAASLLVLRQGGVLTLPGAPLPYRLATWLLASVLVLRTVGDFRYVGLFKRERRTRFATYDTRIFTPLCGLLAAGVLYLAAT